MAKLVESLARLILPDEHDVPAALDTAADAGQLYDFVEAAREILKGGRK
jgi:hypothetical protein